VQTGRTVSTEAQLAQLRATLATARYDRAWAQSQSLTPAQAIEDALSPKYGPSWPVNTHRSTPGEGHIPWLQIFTALREIGYDGYLTVEAFGRALPEVAAATCIWREMFPSEAHLARSARQFIRAAW
jgi:sugar phosphate isomerase/epimerase